MFDDDVDPQVPMQIFFPVHLTASLQTGGTWFYSWTQQQISETAAFADADSPASGTTTTAPFMVEINNQQVSTPCYAWARARGVNAGNLYYEFMGPTSSGSSSTFPTNPTAYTFVGASFVWNWTYTTSLTISLSGGPLTFSGQPVIFGDYFRVADFHDVWNADQTDYNLSALCTVLIANVTGTVHLKSIANGADGRLLWIVNSGNGTLILDNENAAGTAADRLRLPNAAGYTLKQYEGIGLKYDGTDSRWYCLDDAPGITSVAGLAGKGDGWYQNVGVAGGLGERWYLAGQKIAGATAATSFTNGQLFAVPLRTDRGGTLDKIGILVQGTPATFKFRLGIYNNTSDTNIYPSTLLVDAGEITTTTGTGGVYSESIAGGTQALTANTLYWAVILLNTTESLSAIQGAQMDILLGWNNAFTSEGVSLFVAQAYGALPGTYPAAATIVTAGNTAPAIWVRFSA